MKSLAKNMNTDKNMTDNKMNPEQFVERWLPDFEKKYGEPIVALSLTNRSYNHNFSALYFPAALAAYTDHIRKEAWDQACKKQRENCAEEATTRTNDEHTSIIVDYDSILNAPAPEFKITENPETKNEER